ncbi:hypothetical protein RQP46_000141 [Phenoliferia psychrophenolica]
MASAPNPAGSKRTDARNCICCMAPAKLRCSGCQRVHFCSTAWGVHKYLCKGTDQDAFRQPPLLRKESDVYAQSRRVNADAPESALIGLEPHGKTGVLADVLRGENASVDPLEYVWSVFQSTFMTATPARSNLIISLVRFNNYKNSRNYPTGAIDRAFSSHKAFCKGFRQIALTYFLLHTFERGGHVATDPEIQLFESAIARVLRIAEELRSEGDEGAARIAELHWFFEHVILVNFKKMVDIQRVTGVLGRGDGHSWSIFG